MKKPILYVCSSPQCGIFKENEGEFLPPWQEPTTPPQTTGDDEDEDFLPPHQDFEPRATNQPIEDGDFVPLYL